MITFLSRLFIKHREDTSSLRVRTAYGILCGIVGICLNLLLFAGKLFAGILSGSIAATTDAFNNLSDAGSSIITLTGFKLAGQKPDSEHPFGHGRFEYIAGLVVSMIILLMGFELLKTSFEKIIKPEEMEFNLLAMIILIISIAIKGYMAFYNSRVGKKISSSAMKATALDSFSDIAATTAVLISMLLNYFVHINVDGYCGAIVAIFIMFAGIKAAKETISPLLGQPPEEEFVNKIQEIVLAHDGIVGIHDLIVHDYGPGRVMISLHAEVPASSDIWEAHDMIDNIEKELTKKLNCSAVIHMDPIETDNEVTIKAKEEVIRLLKDYDQRISIHDFRMVVGNTHTNLIFDAVVPFDFIGTDNEIREKLAGIIHSSNSSWYAVITIDKSYTKTS